jgi:hypothetical protein
MSLELYARKRAWPHLEYCLAGGTEENNEKVQKDSRYPGVYLNPGPSEYEAGVLSFRLRRSVSTVVSKQYCGSSV